MRTFDQIEQLRKHYKITRKQLYERAGIHKETWRRTAQSKTSPNVKTLQDLSEAIDTLISERGDAHA
ncbi:helix-turn-helix domain-containing protein [Brucella sp. 10RB9212]|uniref:Helix-turn-helix transcriptional regulator n=1 Tax=Brucella intermedia TaxID=94625 RepID=A0A7V6PFF6_9HYPH|nr:helix-turn-helix transcriptional regulator [Brucella intermedia]APY13186.1 hypothetical protein BKD02_01695 [Brucella sp. 09RB8910]MRN46148.1 helix-turn-helix domain-containing protein [Brucella sp. 10RB9212]HHV70009.1 helix-turn-helix transcriptional regulator [Brucella intermedia]